MRQPENAGAEWPAALAGPDKLQPQHQRMIEESGITPEIAAARGYRTETIKSHLRGMGFSERQLNVPALLIPLWGTDGQPAGYQVRPDQPRVGESGRLVKYETPRKAGLRLDIHPHSLPFLADPSVPLFITEGIRKGDSAASRGLCCVALSGVWGWRGQNRLGGVAVLPDWEHVPLKARDVYLVFDSDAMTNPAVYDALARLRSWLESKGTRPYLVYLPAGEHGQKTGLDDYLAGGHTTDDLLALATAEIREAPAARAADPTEWIPYRMTENGIFHTRRTQDSEIEVPLTNFPAQIVADVQEDDGAEVRRLFTIQAGREGNSRTFDVPASDFAGMDWPLQHLGPGAILWPGHGSRDHARAAIQLLSGEVPGQTVYCHSGWRRIGDQWLFLHAGGAIGGPEDIHVKALAELERFHLPTPPIGDDLAAAIRASLRFLEIAREPENGDQLWPLLAAVYAAPLAEVIGADVLTWISGPTGQQKSTCAALACCHFGPFTRSTLPASFESTGNAVEILLFHGKDLLIGVDDFAPSTDARSAAAQDEVCRRLLRTIGDSKGRLRATPDSRLRTLKRPRAHVLVTAEIPPPGSQSSAARVLEVRWVRQTVDLDRLTSAQEVDAPRYALAMAGYLAWLSPQLDLLREQLPALICRWARDAGETHARIAASLCKLFAGVHSFLRFAQESGAITERETSALRDQAWDALLRCAARTEREQQERRPEVMFIQYLQALLSGETGYVSDRWTDQPAGKPGPGAVKLGWDSESEGIVYLLTDVSHQAVTKYSSSANVRFPISARALGEALSTSGMLARQAPGRWTYQVRVGGCAHNAWAIHRDMLFPGSADSADSADSAEEEAGFVLNGNGARPGINQHSDSLLLIPGPDSADPRPIPAPVLNGGASHSGRPGPA